MAHYVTNKPLVQWPIVFDVTNKAWWQMELNITRG